jgi:hypothetical protein
MLERDSLYGNLLGAVGPPNRPPDPEPEDLDAGTGKSQGDDIFAEPPPKVSSSPMAPASQDVVSGPAPAPTAETKEEPQQGPSLPQAFSAAKLMMPPVRKKAEPSKPMMPKLDIAKLQEEKEALMRQRAAAAVAQTSSANVATSGGASPSSAAPAFVRADSLAAADDGVTASSLPTSLYGSPDEEYDPAKPNDYDEFCRRRMRLKAEEELEKRRQEALARHQKGQAVPEPKEDDFATKMMKKMGWTQGSGLGKESQGMSTPLVLKKTDQKQGVMVEGQKREAPAAQPQVQAAKQAKVAPQRPPSCVLLLNNLVGAGEVDEDLEGETAEEAGKYGKLKKCAIKEIPGLPDDQAVRIFLEYETVEEATKALVDMNGRYFGGRIVKAVFFDPARFAAGDLDKKPDD